MLESEDYYLHILGKDKVEGGWRKSSSFSKESKKTIQSPRKGEGQGYKVMKGSVNY